jgi:multiple sugar transport system substrate-binding protein
MKSKISLLLLLFVLIITSGFGCKGISKKVEDQMKPITLKYWRVWDGPDAFEEVIQKYNVIHPFIKIEYKKLRYSEYEKELIDALAEDRGPDIFSIHNTWLLGYKNKIVEMPPTITLVYPILKGSVDKEIVPELRTTKSITLNDIKNNFVDVVYNDIVIEDVDKDDNVKQNVYGLPLSVDSLAVFYNKDIYNNSGIAEPPRYWNREFQQAVKKMTKQDAKGKLIQSGVSMGGSKNIERYSDILSVLMMQNGTNMMNGNGRVIFHELPSSLKSQNYNPGMEALRFYTDFSNPSKEVYCWNSTLDNSLDLFIQGKLGMMFGYAYHLPTIRARAPKLNFAISNLPQIEGSSEITNFANYWVEVVSKKSENIDDSWDFLKFITKEEQVKSYLEKTNKPTALRSLVGEQVDSLDVGVFAEQVLTAKSWYRGADSNAMELIFVDMIDETNDSNEELTAIINRNSKRTQQTITNE